DSVRRRAEPTATGTASAGATMLESTGPHASAAMPNRAGLLSGNHAFSVNKLDPALRNAGVACTKRNTPMATMSTTTTSPDPRVTSRKAVSARRVARRRLADRASAGESTAVMERGPSAGTLTGRGAAPLRGQAWIDSAGAAATEVALGSTKLPPAFFTFTVPRELALSNDSSAYPMAPSVCFTAAVTPSEPLAPWPVGHGTSLAAPNVHTEPAAAVRYDVNAAVVPEPSERRSTWMPSG